MHFLIYFGCVCADDRIIHRFILYSEKYVQLYFLEFLKGLFTQLQKDIVLNRMKFWNCCITT